MLKKVKKLNMSTSFIIIPHLFGDLSMNISIGDVLPQVVLCGAGCSLRSLVGFGAGHVCLGGSLLTGGTATAGGDGMFKGRAMAHH